jgi:hypothetical protein
MQALIATEEENYAASILAKKLTRQWLRRSRLLGRLKTLK